jgi:uncharacterized cupredoxin-like copper-binding protein
MAEIVPSTRIRSTGSSDFLGGRDFGDIIALVDGREELVGEIANADEALRRYLAQEICALMELLASPTACLGRCSPMRPANKEPKQRVRRRVACAAAVTPRSRPRATPRRARRPRRGTRHRGVDFRFSEPRPTVCVRGCRMFVKGRIATSLVCASIGAVGLALPAQAHTAVAAATTTVNVTAGKPSEFRFTLSKSTVKAGSVTFKVTNKGKLSHDFKIGGKTTPLLKPGKSASMTVTLKKGKSAYQCTVPGHAAAGMKGTLTAN